MDIETPIFPPLLFETSVLVFCSILNTKQIYSPEYDTKLQLMKAHTLKIFFDNYKAPSYISICMLSEIRLRGCLFFYFLLKVICFQTLGRLFFYFFMTYYKLFTK